MLERCVMIIILSMVMDVHQVVHKNLGGFVQVLELVLALLLSSVEMEFYNLEKNVRMEIQMMMMVAHLV